MSEKASYISYHKITERQTIKIMPVEGRTVDFVARRMYDCFADVQGQEILDDELGVLARVLDVKLEDGYWHEIKPVEFVKARYEADTFYNAFEKVDVPLPTENAKRE